MFDKLEDEYGLRITDFRASNMQALMKVADKLGVDYEVDNMDMVIYDTDKEPCQLFIQLCRSKRCTNWTSKDWDTDSDVLTVHFSK